MIDETMVLVTTIIEIEIMDKDPVIIMTVTIETIVRTTEIVIKIFIIDLNMDNLVTEIMEVLVIIDNLMKGMLYLVLTCTYYMGGDGNFTWLEWKFYMSGN